MGTLGLFKGHLSSLRDNNMLQACSGKIYLDKSSLAKDMESTRYIFTREVRNSREAPRLPISLAGPAASRIKGERRMISGSATHRPSLILGWDTWQVDVKDWAFLAAAG